jgi:hypothetical protein
MCPALFDVLSLQTERAALAYSRTNSLLDPVSEPPSALAIMVRGAGAVLFAKSIEIVISALAVGLNHGQRTFSAHIPGNVLRIGGLR